jgi:perosamine synthetase
MAELDAPSKVAFSTAEVEQFLARARSAAESDWLISGPNNAELEQRFADFIGGAYSVAVASGTAALEIVLRALGLGGSTVLLRATPGRGPSHGRVRRRVLP